MKRFIFLLPFILLSVLWTGCATTEQVDRLEGQVAELNAKLDQLAEESQAYKSLLEDLSARLNSPGSINSNSTTTPLLAPVGTTKTVQKEKTGTRQCKATTKKGTQCSRNAKEGSDYCWQHQGFSGGGNSQSISSGSREILTGPRGGQYYINSKGKKTYIRKKK